MKMLVKAFSNAWAGMPMSALVARHIVAWHMVAKRVRSNEPQVVISYHIMSIHVHSCLMFWNFGTTLCAYTFGNHLALDIIELICGCWTLLLLCYA